MGKRVEKALRGAGGPASANSRGEDSATPDPYTCTGNFADDFLELWQRAGLDKDYAPGVKARGKRPGTPNPDETKTSPMAEEEHEHIDEDPAPTTYIAVDKFTFFRPSIQVEFETEETRQQQINHAQQVFIRGWRLEEKVLNVLKQCLLDKLTTLNLWNAGLTDHTFQILINFLPQLITIKSVTIEGNAIPNTEPFYKLFTDDFTLQNISLRNNQITDKGAESISKLLGSPTSQNRYLLNLDLAFNRIADEGAKHIATGLRMNRTLMTLSLASNKISDKGAQAFSDVLQWFTLTHDEVVQRRKLQQVLYDRGNSALGSRRADSKDRPGSNRSGSQVDKGRGGRGSSKKKPDAGKAPEKTPKKDEGRGKKGELSKMSSKASVTSETPKNKGRKSGGAGGKDGKRGGTTLEVDAPDVVEYVNPLLDGRIQHKHGKVYVPGCFTLVSLNLSRNLIGERGMKYLLQVVRHQVKQKNKGIITPIVPGLFRLSLQKNFVPHDNSIYLEIFQTMLDRDPIKSESKTPEDDLISVAG